jgi:hypothetical protein
VPAVAGVESHRCYLEARNECGVVRSSTKLVVMPKVPSPVSSMHKKVSDCTLQISWPSPAANGEPITNFIVEVQTGQGYWAEVDECGKKPEDRKCSIHMSNLAGAPFFLKPESPIYTRVRAVNAVGTS